MKKQTCQALREKPTRYLSARNPSGKSLRKCGRVAVAQTQYGKPVCLECGGGRVKAPFDNIDMLALAKLSAKRLRRKWRRADLTLLLQLDYRQVSRLMYRWKKAGVIRQSTRNKTRWVFTSNEH